MKKFVTWVIAGVIMMQTCSVIAYDLNGDTALKQKWNAFANKYTYDIKLQEKVFFEWYPEITPSVSYGSDSLNNA